MCDGTSYLRTAYPALFTAIGTAYGTVDGTHFNVPDLRGQFLRGRDGGAGVDPDRTTRTALKTGGATGDNVGSAQATATKRPTTGFTTGTGSTATGTTGTESATHTHTVTTGTESASHTHHSGSTQGGSTPQASTGSGGTWNVATDAESATHTHSGTTATEGATHTHSVPALSIPSLSVTSGGDNESRPPNVNVNFIIMT
jgi:microcystin-dependent protein